MLYRGVSKRIDDKNGGLLLPRGNQAKVTPLIDGTWKLDGSFVLGSSEKNTARAHQSKPGKYGGSGISTTRCEYTAVKFATNDYQEEGYIYVIDEDKLQTVNVYKVELENPEYPNEQEVTLIVHSGGPIPTSLIVKKYEVTKEGYPK